MNTQQIPKDQANKMIESYLESIQAEVENSNLHSLIFDADQLREYLETNNGCIKKIKVMFAHTMRFINEGHQGENAGYRRGALTLVIAGYDANSNYVYWDGDCVMDNATECPMNCPTGGTAASNTLV